MNEFAAVEIHLPKEFQKEFHAFCLTRVEGSRNDPEESPFPRMVDMWFLAMCLAVKEGISPDFKRKGETYNAIPGSVFGSDPWRSDVIMLLAIAHTGDVEISVNPREMIKIANAYAIAGLPRLIHILNDRTGDTALDHISDFLVDITT